MILLKYFDLTENKSNPLQNIMFTLCLASFKPKVAYWADNK